MTNRTQRKSSVQEQFFRQRRALLLLGTAGILKTFLPYSRLCFANAQEECYPTVKDLVHLDPLESPLFVFRDYEGSPDREISSHIFKGIAERSNFLTNLRNDAGFKKRVSVSLESLRIKLLFVPEMRKKYADAYRQYCNHVIDYALTKTGFDNPYLGIVNPLEEYPEIPPKGITAFTVHQLGKQYEAICNFSDEEGRFARYKIEGAIFSNHLGAVTLVIENPAEGYFSLRRRNYSIWQNRTKNLYTLLSIPIEETFHFIMGRHTDKKIAEELKGLDEPRVFEVQNLANHWMAVEEALVGGLVKTLLRCYINESRADVLSSGLDLDIEKTRHLPLYEFRKTGIALVDRLGYKEAISMYKSDPAAFSQLLRKG